jgi:serine phosphatase RsbU (regulator of sigma subunit)
MPIRRDPHRQRLQSGQSDVLGVPETLQLFPWIARRSRAWRAAIVVGLLALVACLDVLTTPDLSFLAFYFLPVLLACWYLGSREGIAVALASVATWILDDVISHRHYSHFAIPIWNQSVKLAFFIFLAWLVGALKLAAEGELRARTERIEHDLAVARDVQAALLPARRQRDSRYVTAAECRQAFGVGGDAYDVIRLEGDALALCIADVSGKGLPAALLMASFLASLRALLPLKRDRLDSLVEELSERLRASLAGPRFVTAFIAIAENGWLRYVNAGHDDGLVVAPGEGEARHLPSTGPVLGLLPAARFEEQRVPFPPNALLALYTDGLTECVDPQGEELGPEGVARVVAGAATREPAEVVARLLAAAEEHAAGEPFPDDVTILCVRRR